MYVNGFAARRVADAIRSASAAPSAEGFYTGHAAVIMLLSLDNAPPEGAVPALARLRDEASALLEDLPGVERARLLDAAEQKARQSLGRP